MEIKIEIKLKEGLKFPNCNEDGEVEEGFWSESEVEDHFKESLVHSLKHKIKDEIENGNYTDDLSFEGIETVEDLQKNFGFDILIDGKSIKLK